MRNLLGNELFEEEVIELEANFKTLAKSLDVLKSVPSIFNSETLQNLIKYIEIFENNQISDSEFRKEIQEKIGSLDLSFRQEITSILKNDGKRTKASRLKAIKKEKKYSWIKNVYPSVLVDEKKVILMTIDKLMMGRQVIVENSPQHRATSRVALFVAYANRVLTFFQSLRFVKASLRAERESLSLRQQTRTTNRLSLICFSYILFMSKTLFRLLAPFGLDISDRCACPIS